MAEAQFASGGLYRPHLGAISRTRRGPTMQQLPVMLARR